MKSICCIYLYDISIYQTPVGMACVANSGHTHDLEDMEDMMLKPYKLSDDPKAIEALKKVSMELEEDMSIDRKAKVETFKNRARKKYPEIRKNNRLLANTNLLYAHLLTRFERGFRRMDERIRMLLILKQSRTGNGVAVISAMTPSHPNGEGMSCDYNCIPCPDPALPFHHRNFHYEPNPKHEAPRSYPPDGPLTSRYLRVGDNPVVQFCDRAVSLLTMGHDVDKVELKVSGGTISNYDKKFLAGYFRGHYYAANNLRQIILGKRPQMCDTVQEEMAKNATADCKIIGCTVETRPDYVTPKELKWFRDFTGLTRLEVGMQHNDKDVLIRFNRKATHLHSNWAAFYTIACGFKLVTHLMPDCPAPLKPEAQKRVDAEAKKIPHDSKSREYRLAFREILNAVDPSEVDYSEPMIVKDRRMLDTFFELGWLDELKLYFHMASAFTPTPIWEKKGIYKSYFDEWDVFSCTAGDFRDLRKYLRKCRCGKVQKRDHRWFRMFKLKHSKLYQLLYEYVQKIPEYTRCDRLGRDIPGDNIFGGMDVTNVNQILKEHLEEDGKYIYDIRSTEIGNLEFDPSEVEIQTIDRIARGDELDFEIPLLEVRLIVNRPYKTKPYLLLAYMRIGFPPTRGPALGIKQIEKTFPELNGALRIRQLEVVGNMTMVGSDATSVQHRGYGRQLMREAEKIARKHGLQKISVVAGRGTYGYYSKKNYEELGYTEEGSFMTKVLSPNTVLDGPPMRKWLLMDLDEKLDYLFPMRVVFGMLLLCVLLIASLKLFVFMMT